MFVLILVSQMTFAAETVVFSPSTSPAATVAAEKVEPKADVKTTDALVAAAPVNEADIPVHLEPTKKSATADSPWLRMFGGLFIVGILSAGALFYIKKMKKVKSALGPAPEIKILTQHHLGPKKSLAIIRVAGESILVGITDQNINLLKSLSLLDEDIPEQVPSSFQSVFNEGEEKTPATNSRSSGKSVSSENEDEFSISGIKDVVTARLKNMRNFQ
jgi:flagellar protein FliO/FliZ